MTTRLAANGPLTDPKGKQRMRIAIRILVALLLGATSAGSLPAAAGVPAIHVQVKTFSLQNGMQFLVVERHASPQVACRLAIRAGSALESAGSTGIAHMLEHMMFKGTKNFGTLDYRRDQALQQKIEAAYQVILDEENKRRPDRRLIKAKRAEMADLRRQVQAIYVPQAFSSQLGKNGAVGINAFTTKDQTQYVASVPSDMLEQWFSIISEQIFEPSWREFYVEREVVQREWAFRYVNNPAGAAWLDLNATAYSAHPYHNPTIGWPADMAHFSATDARGFHHTYYNPSNAVCVLVGDIRLQEVRKLARTYFARYPAGRRAPERVTAEPRQQGPRRQIHYLKGTRTPLVRIAYHGAPMGSDDFYALDVLTMLLDSGRSARLAQHIVEKGLAARAWAANPDNRYSGLFILGGTPIGHAAQKSAAGGSKRQKTASPLEACRKLADRLTAEINRLRTETVSAAELARIKKLNRRDFLDRLRSNESLASTLATLEVQIGWRYLEGYLERIRKVTAQQVRQAAIKYLTPENQTRVYVIPGGTRASAPHPYTEVRNLGSAAAARLKPPASFTNHSIYPTPEEWRHPLSFVRRPKKVIYPAARTWQSAGARVFYLPDRELPLVDLTLLIRAGRVDVPAAKAGLAALLNRCLIRGGTRSHGPKEFALLLDQNAIRLSLDVRREETELKLSVLKDDWRKGLALLAELIRQPAFDPDVLAVARRQEITALQRQGGNAQTVAHRELMIWHFKGHLYGRDPLAALKTLPDLTRTDLTHFVRTYFVAANMVAAVAGDINQQAVRRGLEAFFAQLPNGPAPVRNLPLPPATPPVMTLIDKPGQVQSQVFLALPGIRRTQPGYWQNRLLMDIFGGSDSLLYKRLRDDLGLVYATWFTQTYRWRAGLLIGYIGCRADQTAEAIAQTLAIMRDLRRHVPRTLFAQKRLDALNSFVFNVDTPLDLTETYARYFLRKEPLDTLERIQDAFLHATVPDLQKLAHKLLDPHRVQVFIVTDRQTPVSAKSGATTVENALKTLARRLQLPFREAALR